MGFMFYEVTNNCFCGKATIHRLQDIPEDRVLTCLRCGGLSRLPEDWKIKRARGTAYNTSFSSVIQFLPMIATIGLLGPEGEVNYPGYSRATFDINNFKNVSFPSTPKNYAEFTVDAIGFYDSHNHIVAACKLARPTPVYGLTASYIPTMDLGV